jgi:hypothetical protein
LIGEDNEEQPQTKLHRHRAPCDGGSHRHHRPRRGLLDFARGTPVASWNDAAREFAYGPARELPDVKLGYFTPALEEHAKKDGWTVVSMKNDWKTVFPAP